MSLITDSLIVLEHFYECEGNFRRCSEAYRSANGSHEWRDRIAEIGESFNSAYIEVSKLTTDGLSEALEEKFGCWDFEAVPAMLEDFYDRPEADHQYSMDHSDAVELFKKFLALAQE
ncbi:hypothetical protein [uncultured Amphritea sp.]|uniref:hypothetical protein n=1 Tax=uncultured Amphritea sp. TaxID=981605 RepID=UPI0026205E04|nr:hypothetical protein [uncultured Amphritea sp.]